MMLTDTHAHLYAEEFDADREEIIRSALDAEVRRIILPNIDEHSIQPMLDMQEKFPGICFPLMGIHPTSVRHDYKHQLSIAEKWLSERKFAGIGEIGIDLYWDSTFLKEQEEAFRIQLGMARSSGMAVVIHVRNSFEEVFRIVEDEQNGSLKGVFHCFSGGLREAVKVISQGFFLGIGGVITFKNNKLQEVLGKVDPGNILLETDSPWLAPVPFRGKRNESAYLPLIAERVAEIYNTTSEKIAAITTANAEKLFGIESHNQNSV